MVGVIDLSGPSRNHELDLEAGTERLSTCTRSSVVRGTTSVWCGRGYDRPVLSLSKGSTTDIDSSRNGLAASLVGGVEDVDVAEQRRGAPVADWRHLAGLRLAAVEGSA